MIVIKLLGLALLVLSTISVATDLKLNWVKPELNQDGTAIQEIEKHNLYYTINNVLQDIIEVSALSDSYTIQNIKAGTHTLQVSTVADGTESELSTPKTVILSNSKPVKIHLTVEIIE